MPVKVIFAYNDGIYFECTNHADTEDLCVIISTLCAVLTKACEMQKIPISAQGKGHTKIIIEHPKEVLLTGIFKAVEDVFYEVADQHPFRIKMY